MDIDAIADLLKQRIGLDVDSVGKSSIVNAVKTRINKTNSGDVRVYQQLLQDSPLELNELIEESVIPETWFFRDEEAIWSAVKDVKAYLAKPRANPVHILCIPCASGEEPYSLAMALLDADIATGTFRIDAIDISQRLLERANRGIYGSNSFRGVAVQAFKEHYFEYTGANWRLRDDIRGLVNFRQGNLLETRYFFERETYDIIFCRNLMIYFDRETQLRCTAFLVSLLRQGGSFYSGPAEGALLLEQGFRSNGVALAFGFQRAEEKTATKTTNPTATKKTIMLSNINKLQPIKVAHKPILKKLTPTLANSYLTSDNLDLTPQINAIAAQANQGNLSEAISQYEALIRQYGVSAPLLYALAFAQDASGNKVSAEKNYRKALYLDPYHRDAMVNLAFLLDAQGNFEAAEHLRQRAQRIKVSA